MNSIALRSTAFNQEEFDYTSRQPDNVHQKETFLKTLIRKGHYKCKLFLQELARSGYKDEVDICLTERMLIVLYTIIQSNFPHGHKILCLVPVLRNSQTLRDTRGIERVPSFSDVGYKVF